MASKKLILINLAIILFSAFLMLAASRSSVMVGEFPLFILSALCAYVLHWLAFVPAYLYQTERYFDLTGSLSFLSSVTLAIALHPDLNPLQLLLAALICIWAIRLGYFLFSRILQAGKDKRFDEIKRIFWRFFLTWTLGATWVFVTLAMALVALTNVVTRGIDGFAIAGTLIWLTGFAIEVIADTQKSRFRANPENESTFIDTGLWAYSRHPNYFGEIVLWIGIAVIALPSLSGLQWVTVISPLFVILLLTKVSGIPLLEKSALERWGNDEEYQRYLKSTPVLVPLPRRTSE